MCELVYISVVIVSCNLFVYCAQETSNTCVPKVMCLTSSPVRCIVINVTLGFLFCFPFFSFFFWVSFSQCMLKKKTETEENGEKNLWHLGFSRRFFLTASMAKETSHKMLMKGLQTYFRISRSHEKISQLRDFLSRFLNDFAQFFRLSHLSVRTKHTSGNWPLIYAL